MKRLRSVSTTVVAVLVVALLATPASVLAADDPPPPGANDFSCEPSKDHPRPVLLLHGLGSNMSENWSYHSPRLRDAGYCVFALTYGEDPRTRDWPGEPVGGIVRMQESARELKAFVRRVLQATRARRVDLVGHSEGTVMPRWYLERLGGAGKVRSFVALTPLWRGTNIGGAAFLRDSAEPLGLSDPVIDLVASFCASCPQFVRGSRYLDQLNADGEAVPGIKHTNIVTLYDELVRPPKSGVMRDGGRNVILQEVCPQNTSEHLAVAVDPVVTQLILNALDRRDARRVRC